MPDQVQKEEITFGQIAVQLGITTPERVRECLDIQNKIRSIGGKPRLLGDIMYEKGFLTADQINRIFHVQQAYVNQAKGILKIPNYEILNKIGQGGMGSVYRARQISMDRLVALKILPHRLARDRQFVDRFLNEARAVARLRHENIILGIDAGESNGVYYFAMEYVEGETVQQILQREGRLEERRALGIARQIASALQHAYDHRLVHRDIKPSNILIARDGVAKLCDLGLAKVQHRTDAASTQMGMAVGTPHYISPEQARGESEVDIRSDLYSLGASLYHMVVGEVPFTGPNAAVVMSKHVTTPPVPPREKVPALTAGTNALILRCMSKHREQRFQTPAELVQEIKRILEMPPPPVRPAQEEPKPRAAAAAPVRRHIIRRRQAPGLFLLLLLLAAGAALTVSFILPGSDRRAGPAPPRPPGDGGTAIQPPAPNDAPSAHDRRLRQLEADVRQVFAEANRLKDLAPLYGRLEEFARATAGSPTAAAATALIESFKQRVNARSDEEWRKVREEAEPTLRAGRLAEVLAAYRRFPRPLLAFCDDDEPPIPLMTRGGKECNAAVTDLRFRIRGAYWKHVEEMTAASRQKDARRAWQIGRSILIYTIPDLERDSSAQLREIVLDRDEKLAKVLAAAIEAACATGQFEEVRRLCHEVLHAVPAMPDSLRKTVEAIAPSLPAQEEAWKRDKRHFIWTAYETELQVKLIQALAERDIAQAKSLLKDYYFKHVEERKGTLWLGGVDYVAVQKALGAEPVSTAPTSPFLASIERAIGEGNPDAAQDPARAALCDLRAILLLDDLYRRAEAGARAQAEAKEPIVLLSSQKMDPGLFPGARCDIQYESGGHYAYRPAGKPAPRVGFGIRKGQGPLLLEDDVIALAGREYDAGVRRVRTVTPTPLRRFQFGLLLLTGRNREKAKQATAEFDAARKGGIPALGRYLGAGAAPAPGAGDAKRTQAIRDRIELVRDVVRRAAAQKTQWAFARREFDRLVAEFGKDPLFAAHLTEVNALQQRIQDRSPSP